MPKVYGYSVGQEPYIAMEYVEGVDLDKAWKGLGDERKENMAKGMRMVQQFQSWDGFLGETLG